MKNNSTWSTSFSNLKNGGKDIMKNLEKDALTKIENEMGGDEENIIIKCYENICAYYKVNYNNMCKYFNEK